MNLKKDFMTVCNTRCHDWNLKTSFPAFSQREDSPRQLFPPLSSLRTQSMETSSFQGGIGRRTREREIVLYYVLDYPQYDQIDLNRNVTI